MLLMEKTDITIKIPLELKEKLQKYGKNLDAVIVEALENVISRNQILDSYSEVSNLKESPLENLKSSDIPPGSYIRLPDLTLERYEKIVDESSWEYLDGVLFHHSPESNHHNAILNLLNHRAMSNLDPELHIIRTSRVAISINGDKPEPDFMIFDRDDFRKKKRTDGSESEIIESAPLLVIEIVSKSTSEIDAVKKEKYLSKGIKEFWRIYAYKSPIIVSVCCLKKGKYEEVEYHTGEIRSRVLPDFAITFDEILNPDSSR